MSLNPEKLQILVKLVTEVKKQVEKSLSHQPVPNELQRIAPRIANAERLLKELQQQVATRDAEEKNALHAALQYLNEAADDSESAHALSHTEIKLNMADYAPLTISAPQQGSIGLQTAMKAAVFLENQILD